MSIPWASSALLPKRAASLSLLPLLGSPFRNPNASCFLRFSSSSPHNASEQHANGDDALKQGTLKSGLYLVATPIGNLEDITLRALRVLKSADVILTEDTRHSGKLLQYYNIKTPMVSYHKFNESQREMMILQKLQQGQLVALISDAGTPGISDPGMELARLCATNNIPVVPIPGPSAVVAALSVSGLSTSEFTFVGFLSKHGGSRRERLEISSNESATQIFFVPPHKLSQFLEEASSIFGESRCCVIAREMTKIHEEFWRGSLGEAREVFSSQQPRGEITLLIEGNANSVAEIPSDSQIEHHLKVLISNGHSLSMAVRLVSEGTSVKKKQIYALALKLSEKSIEDDEQQK
ncbi:putative 16S rRNA (cytidine(1402)-2'-O)-methyltransferase [Dioscorea sansibarensis]